MFARYNLEQIGPADEPFNPELHEAMTMVPVPNVDPNTVIDVLEKGYQLNGRLIRPAGWWSARLPSKQKGTLALKRHEAPPYRARRVNNSTVRYAVGCRLV